MLCYGFPNEAYLISFQMWRGKWSENDFHSSFPQILRFDISPLPGSQISQSSAQSKAYKENDTKVINMYNADWDWLRESRGYKN